MGMSFMEAIEFANMAIFPATVYAVVVGIVCFKLGNKYTIKELINKVMK